MDFLSRLDLALEGFFKDTRQQVKPLMAAMPKRKRVHSREVARSLYMAGAGKTGVRAGFAHDYLERGGDLESLQKYAQEWGWSPRVVAIVRALSSDEKEEPDPDDSPQNPPLEHLKAAVASPDVQADPKTRNLILLVKLADRLSNVRKRIRHDGGLRAAYRQKASDIAEFCRANYDGKSNKFRPLYHGLRGTIDTCKVFRPKKAVKARG